MLAIGPDHLPTNTESILTRQLWLSKSRLTHSGRRLSLSNPSVHLQNVGNQAPCKSTESGTCPSQHKTLGSQAIDRCLTEHGHRSNAVRTPLRMSERNAGHAKARKCWSTVSLLWFREVPGACQTSLQPNGLIMVMWRKGHGNRAKHSKWES